MKTTEIGGHHREYDGGKKLKGRKRHLLVDTLGLLIAVVVTGANLDDGTAAPQLLTRVTAKDFPRLTTIFGDNQYHNHSSEAWLAKERPTGHIETSPAPSQPHRLRACLQTLGRGTHQCLGRTFSPQQ